MDRSLVSKVLLIVAVVCAAVAWFAGAGWVDEFDALTWAFGSLTAFFASRLVLEL